MSFENIMPTPDLSFMDITPESQRAKGLLIDRTNNIQYPSKMEEEKIQNLIAEAFKEGMKLGLWLGEKE